VPQFTRTLSPALLLLVQIFLFHASRQRTLPLVTHAFSWTPYFAYLFMKRHGVTGKCFDFILIDS